MSEEKLLGAGEGAAPDYQEVKVGKYTISRFDDKSVWIQTESGEGGQFYDDSFFLVVDAYYRSNF